MAQIDLKSIKNPVHRKMMEYYGTRLSNSPLLTQFHKIPILENDEDALDPKLNLTPLVLDDLVYRFYTKNAVSILIWGPRRNYKSTLALWFWLRCYEIGNIKPDYDNIVDNDISLLDRYMKKAPPFTAFLKDEYDTTISGIGNQTTSQTLINVIKRSAYFQKPVIICSPVFKPYPVDYYLQVWEFQRYGEKKVKCLVYDHNSAPKGWVVLPMPSDAEIDTYDRLRKQKFMGNMEKMKFTIEEELDTIAEGLVNDPDISRFDLNKKPDRIGFQSWAFKKYPVLQSKTLQDNIMDRVRFLAAHGLKKML